MDSQGYSVIGEDCLKQYRETVRDLAREVYKRTLEGEIQNDGLVALVNESIEKNPILSQNMKYIGPIARTHVVAEVMDLIDLR